MATVKRLTMRQFESMVNEAVSARLKGMGMDKVDVRHGILPSYTSEDIRKLKPQERAVGMVKALFERDYVRASAMSGTVGPEGGYLLPEEFRQDVIRQIQTIPVIRGQASVFPVTTMAGSIPKMQNFVATFWEGQNQQFQSTKFGTGTGNVELGQLLWRVWRLDGFMTASRELFDDAGFNVYNLFVQLFATQFRVAEDAAFMTGTGVGQPQGIRNAGVTQNPSQSGSHLAYKDLVTLQHAVPYQYRVNCTWLMPDYVVQTVRQMVDANGRPIWVEPTTFGDLTQAQPARLLGYPVIVQANIPINLGSGSSSEIWFGNLRWYYVFDRQQMAAETTIEGAGAFEKHQQILKVTQRVDGQLSLADPVAFMQVTP